MQQQRRDAKEGGGGGGGVVTSRVALTSRKTVESAQPSASRSTKSSVAAFVATLLLAAVTSTAHTAPSLPRSPTANNAVALQPWPTAACTCASTCTGPHQSNQQICAAKYYLIAVRQLHRTVLQNNDGHGVTQGKVMRMSSSDGVVQPSHYNNKKTCL